MRESDIVVFALLLLPLLLLVSSLLLLLLFFSFPHSPLIFPLSYFLFLPFLTIPFPSSPPSSLSDDASLAALNHLNDGNIYGQKEMYKKRTEDRSILRLAHALWLGLSSTYDGERSECVGVRECGRKRVCACVCLCVCGSDCASMC